MNQWPIYDRMKNTFRETGKKMTAKEVKSEFPGANMMELREGMIEFELAYEQSFKYEQRPFISEVIEEMLGNGNDAS